MSEPLPNSTSEINDALGTKETSLGNIGVTVAGSGYPNGEVPVVEGDDDGEESDTYDIEGEGDDQEGGEEYDEEDEDEGTEEKKSSLTALLLGNGGPDGPTQNGAPDHQGVEVIDDDEEAEDDDEDYVDEPENGYGQGHGDSHPGAVLAEDDGGDFDEEDEGDEGAEVEELPDPNLAASNGSKKRTIDEVHEDGGEDVEEAAGGVKKVKA